MSILGTAETCVSILGAAPETCVSILEARRERLAAAVAAAVAKASVRQGGVWASEVAGLLEAALRSPEHDVGGERAPQHPLATGWHAVDSFLAPDGGLRSGALHECMLAWDPDRSGRSGRSGRAGHLGHPGPPVPSDPTSTPGSRHAGRPAAQLLRRADPWLAPLSLLVHLAWQAIDPQTTPGPPGLVLWIGRAVRPNVHSLLRRSGVDLDMDRDVDRTLLRASLIVEADTVPERLWAADLALRSRAVRAVIADGSGFDMAATRRLQLAAEAGGGVALIARPEWERDILSAATTRWAMETGGAAQDAPSHPSPAPSHPAPVPPTFRLRLLRRKSRATDGAADWRLELNHETAALALAAAVADRSGAAPHAA